MPRLSQTAGNIPTYLSGQTWSKQKANSSKRKGKHCSPSSSSKAREVQDQQPTTQRKRKIEWPRSKEVTSQRTKSFQLFCLTLMKHLSNRVLRNTKLAWTKSCQSPLHSSIWIVQSTGFLQRVRRSQAPPNLLALRATKRRKRTKATRIIGA